MLAEERFSRILSIIEAEGSATIQELMTALDASESTVRRDLITMDENGLLTKVHGGAIARRPSVSTHDEDVRNQKNAIAKYAASLIRPDDFVYLDAGTSTEAMIPFIKETQAVFVTNAISHAKLLAEKGCRVYLLGGEFKSQTEAIVGEEAMEMLSKYNFTKGFWGTNGISVSKGYSTPEIKEAMALGMEYAKKCNADLLLATDPDCDRVGIAVKNKAGEYELLTGNQTGMLLLDYICSQRVKHGKMPADPVMVKTIVTMDMGEQIATHYGLRTINVLTGFKFIGEQIGKLEKQGKTDSYVFGFEESYGYLTGSYVRDKDGVDGAYMICEMFSYYATQGISLLDKLDELYKTYSYCLNTLHSYEFDGSAGFAKMQSIMQAFRGGIKEFGGKKVVKLLDYAPGLDGLPKSDVLKFLLEDNCSIVVRPSGTEPKLKTYISVSAENKEAAEKVEAEIRKSAEEYLK